MAKIITLIIIGLSVAAPGLAQRRGVRDTQNDVRLVRNRPTVYLEFVKAGFCKSDETNAVVSSNPCRLLNKNQGSESYEAVWLRLRNNSRWAINFDAIAASYTPVVEPYKLSDGRWVSSLRNGAEVSARYRGDAEIVWEWVDTPNGRESRLVDVKAPIVNRVSPTGLLTRVWLPPGRSAVFLVKREHLAKYLEIYLAYKHPWEDENDDVSSEPQHRVYFDWYSLQKALGLADAAHNKALQLTAR